VQGGVRPFLSNIEYMCGIAGIYCRTSHLSVQQDTLKRMLAQISYRGPDECGILSSPHLLMGNVRLNIIDLKSGTQPICDQRQRYWIVFNGEIFNYIELREELEKKGYRFKTQSDTEVLVQLYSLYQEKALEKLNGQFALAIWDRRTGDLFLARDRVGIRPLYYAWWEGHFLFGSEIKALLQCFSSSPKINVAGMHQIFTYWAPLTPNTIFEGIYEIPPGHFLTLRNGHTQIKKYWQLSFSRTRNVSLHQALDEFHELLRDAVRLRLRSDVPVAAYLSGGIDSTATTCLIKKIQPHNLQTFSIGFEQDQYDETRYQNEASKFLDTTHQSLTCKNEDIAEHFSRIIWHTEVPITRTAPAPMYFLSSLVKDNNIKVVITGEGADEMLAGYNIFKETLIRHFWSKYPDSKYRPLLLRKLYPYIPYIANANPGLLKMFFGYRLMDTSSPFYSHLIRWNNTSKIKHYLAPELINGQAAYQPEREIAPVIPDDFHTWSPLAKSQFLEISIFLSGYLLSSQGDRMAMAHSIEGRYPFLDHRIMEFAASLPEQFKLKGLTEKYLLKKLMEHQIPDGIVKRSKQAYRAPISPLMNGQKASEATLDILSNNRLKAHGLFDPEKVENLKSKYAKGINLSEMDDMALTGIISSQWVYDLFIHRHFKWKPDISRLYIKKITTL